VLLVGLDVLPSLPFLTALGDFFASASAPGGAADAKGVGVAAEGATMRSGGGGGGGGGAGAVTLRPPAAVSELSLSLKMMHCRIALAVPSDILSAESAGSGGWAASRSASRGASAPVTPATPALPLSGGGGGGGGGGTSATSRGAFAPVPASPLPASSVGKREAPLLHALLVRFGAHADASLVTEAVRPAVLAHVAPAALGLLPSSSGSASLARSGGGSAVSSRRGSIVNAGERSRRASHATPGALAALGAAPASGAVDGVGWLARARLQGASTAASAQILDFDVTIAVLAPRDLVCAGAEEEGKEAGGGGGGGAASPRPFAVDAPAAEGEAFPDAADDSAALRPSALVRLYATLFPELACALRTDGAGGAEAEAEAGAPPPPLAHRGATPSLLLPPLETFDSRLDVAATTSLLEPVTLTVA
jgi:hypothetical protein